VRAGSRAAHCPRAPGTPSCTDKSSSSISAPKSPS
jgi:hypothetical protein